MPVHLPNSENSDPTTITASWPSKVKSPPSEKGLQNIRIPNKISNKKNLKESKPVPKSKTTCICAPTTHPGSFRCHLHRTNNLATKSPLPNISPKPSHSRPPLSRFCTAASTKM
ncbi:hypothetical protein Dsin_031943 [Dipteronia sinensis]|uniref:Uncharacterized protein n=1 Tax=Dipteronia sinensis TaxID=43782 RepID=A0AAD9ZMM1_9ROSI|nr:hypothetical protein Dsin_031943 [Dipteronia sinensis]